MEELTMQTGVGACCGRCRDTALELLQQFQLISETAS
jgi:bacterioferritin-associated ferredoxin